MDSLYQFIGKFLAKPGRRDDLLTLLMEAADALGANPDCFLYVLSTSEEEPDAVWSTEIWTSKAAHDASLAPEEIRQVVARGMALIDAIAEKTEVDVAGGKGLGRLNSAA